jgi:Ca-activated chloride channel homolog
MLPVHIDEALLKQIADMTGGRYFRAQTREALENIYSQINRLEKTKVNVKRYMDYTPWHLPFVLIAAALIVAEWLIRASRWGRVP